jgi:hypothetical protein
VISPFVIKYVTDVEELLDRWPFFYEGWLAVLQHNHGKPKATTNDFMLLLMRAVTSKPSEGCLAVFESKNNKPLGFIVLMNGSEVASYRVAHINMAYTNGKSPGITLAGQKFAEEWSRENGYKELQLRTYRMNGAAQRFFVRKLGFQSMCVIYKKEL